MEQQFCSGNQWKKANKEPCVKFSPSVWGKTNVEALPASSRAGSDVKGQPHVYAGACECLLLDLASRWLARASPASATARFKTFDRVNKVIFQKHPESHPLAAKLDIHHSQDADDPVQFSTICLPLRHQWVWVAACCGASYCMTDSSSQANFLGLTSRSVTAIRVYFLL